MSRYFFVLHLGLFISPLYGAKGRGSLGRSTGVSYPASRGLSGNSYAHSNTRTSQSHRYPHSPRLSGDRTEVHHHYHYSPPQHISYGSAQHPVFHGQPPVYVYQYRNSGSRFDNLLTGLALYNLGRMSSNHYHDNRFREYRESPGEICKLSIHKKNGEYEETRIDCKLMSSFIWESEREQKTTTNVTKTISVVQEVVKDGNSTISVQNTTVVDALQVKGPSIRVSPEMSCFLIRVFRDTSTIKKKVECGLLQEYATRSLQYNSCARRSPTMSITFTIVIVFLLQTLKT